MRTRSIELDPPPEVRSGRWVLFSPGGLAFAAVYLIWGSTYLAIRVGVETIPPFLLAGSRSLIAGVLLLAAAFARTAAPSTWRQWGHAAVGGTLMLTGGNGLVTWAETRVSSSLAALLIAAVPAHVALLDWLRPAGRRPSHKTFLGIVVGLAGMALLVRPGTGVVHDSHWQGVAAVSVAGLCWALGSLYSRYAPMHPDRSMSAAQQMVFGGAALLLIAACRGEVTALDVRLVSGRSLAALIYLTLFGSLLAFSAFNWLVKATTPARLSTTAYVNPVVAVVLGWAVLGERLHPVSLAGAALILGAVALMVSSASPRAPLANGSSPEPALAGSPERR